jgi:hypothetical protein
LGKRHGRGVEPIVASTSREFAVEFNVSHLAAPMSGKVSAKLEAAIRDQIQLLPEVAN